MLVAEAILEILRLVFFVVVLITVMVPTLLVLKTVTIRSIVGMLEMVKIWETLGTLEMVMIVTL